MNPSQQIAIVGIGGISPTNVDAVREAGAERIAVVRALTEARDPTTSAHELRTAITAGVRVGCAK